MKKRTMKKLTSVLLTCLMVMGTFCVGYASGESTTETLTQTITVYDDTYLRPSSPDEPYANATDLTFHQNKTQAVWVRFNLANLNIPAGYEIASAVCSMNINSVWGGACKTEYAVSLNSLSSSIYNVDSITYNSRNNITQKAVLDTVTCTGDGTTAWKGIVNFDIADSSYLNAQLDEGYIAFSLTTSTSSVGGNIDSKEKTNGTPATLTVTYKPITEYTVYAVDSTVVNQNTPDTVADTTATDYSIDNTGNSKYNSRAYFKFDLNGIAIPANKVIKSATLKIYFHGNYVTPQTGNPAKVRIYNIGDSTWTGATMNYNNQPELPADDYSGVGSVPASPSDYVDFDVTAYVSKCYATDSTSKISFMAWPDYIISKTLYFKSHNAAIEYQPMLVIELGDETEFTFRTPQFYSEDLSNSNSASTLKFVVIPAFGASKEPISTSLFVAQYDSETDKLVKVHKKDVTLYSSNGDSAYITSMYVKDTTNYYVKAFLFTDKLVPLTESNGTLTSAQ